MSREKKTAGKKNLGGRQYRMLWILILVVALTMTGPWEYAAAEEDTLRLAIYHPQTLNPLKTTEPSAAQLLMIIFSPLIDTDSNGKPTNRGLVQTWDLSEDGKVLKLTLNKDEEFSNGEQVTEEDVKYSLTALKNANQNYWKEGLQELESVEIVTEVRNEKGQWERMDEETPDWEDETDMEGDAETEGPEETEGTEPEENRTTSGKKRRVIVLRFSGVIDEDHLGFLNIPVLPRSVYDTEDPPEWIPVGSGPYKVISYETMNRIELEENPCYDRFCKIKKIQVDITRTQEAISTAFQNGLTQMIYEEVPSNLSIANLDHNTVYYVDTHCLRYLKLNQQSGRFFSDKEHRQALMVMLSVEEILQRTAALQGETADSLVPDWICSIELSDTYEYDEQRVERLLGTGERTPIRILVEEDDQLAQNQAQLILRTLQSNGLTCMVETVREKEYESAWNSGAYDIAFEECRVENAKDLQSLLVNRETLSGSQNHDTINQLMEKAMTSERRDTRKRAWLELTQYLWEDLPICPLYYTKQSVVVAESVSGSLQATPYMVYRGIEYLDR